METSNTLLCRSTDSLKNDPAIKPKSSPLRNTLVTVAITAILAVGVYFLNNKFDLLGKLILLHAAHPIATVVVGTVCGLVVFAAIAARLTASDTAAKTDQTTRTDPILEQVLPRDTIEAAAQAKATWEVLNGVSEVITSLALEVRTAAAQQGATKEQVAQAATGAANDIKIRTVKNPATQAASTATILTDQAIADTIAFHKEVMEIQVCAGAETARTALLEALKIADQARYRANQAVASPAPEKAVGLAVLAIQNAAQATQRSANALRAILTGTFPSVDLVDGAAATAQTAIDTISTAQQAKRLASSAKKSAAIEEAIVAAHFAVKAMHTRETAYGKAQGTAQPGKDNLAKNVVLKLSETAVGIAAAAAQVTLAAAQAAVVQTLVAQISAAATMEDQITITQAQEVDVTAQVLVAQTALSGAGAAPQVGDRA